MTLAHITSNKAAPCACLARPWRAFGELAGFGATKVGASEGRAAGAMVQNNKVWLKQAHPGGHSLASAVLASIASMWLMRQRSDTRKP